MGDEFEEEADDCSNRSFHDMLVCDVEFLKNGQLRNSELLVDVIRKWRTLSVLSMSNLGFSSEWAHLNSGPNSKRAPISTENGHER